MCEHCAPYSVLDKWAKTPGEADSYGNVDIKWLQHANKAELVLYGPRKLWPLSALIWGEEIERVSLMGEKGPDGRELKAFADFHALVESKGFSIDPAKRRDKLCFDKSPNCVHFAGLSKCHMSEFSELCKRSCGLCGGKDEV